MDSQETVDKAKLGVVLCRAFNLALTGNPKLGQGKHGVHIGKEYIGNWIELNHDVYATFEDCKLVDYQII